MIISYPAATQVSYMATARLIILNGAQKGDELELQRGSNFLGRAEANDFVLNDVTVSARHCEVIVTDFSVRVRDLGSTNGTWIDNRRVLDAEIRNGQVLMLGSMEMRLSVLPAEISIPPLPKPVEAVQTTLDDGRPACINHPGIEAVLKCSQCERMFCEACVRELHLVGGKSRLFCPACSGACQPVAGIAAPPKRKSFASRLLDTIKITFKKSKQEN